MRNQVFPWKMLEFLNFHLCKLIYFATLFFSWVLQKQPRVENASSLDSFHAKSAGRKFWHADKQQFHTGVVKSARQWSSIFSSMPPLWAKPAAASRNDEPCYQYGKSPWTISAAFQIVWTIKDTSPNVLSHWQTSWGRWLPSRHWKEVNYCIVFRPWEGSLCTPLPHGSSRIMVGEFPTHAPQWK